MMIVVGIRDFSWFDSVVTRRQQRRLMPHFEEGRLERYLFQILDAVKRRDRAALKRFGQKDGFVNNYIRRLVW